MNPTYAAVLMTPRAAFVSARNAASPSRTITTQSSHVKCFTISTTHNSPRRAEEEEEK